MKLTINHSEISHERLGTEPVKTLLFKMALMTWSLRERQLPTA